MKKLFLVLMAVLPALGAFAEEVPTVRSDTGQAEFRGSGVVLIVSLVSDYEKTLREWDRPDAAGVPQIETSTKILTGGTVVPFVTFSVKKPMAFPLLCDVDLVKPDGQLSPSDHAAGVVLAGKAPVDDRFYREEAIFGFGITAKYQPGRYVVKLKIYNAETVLCFFEESFQLN